MSYSMLGHLAQPTASAPMPAPAMSPQIMAMLQMTHGQPAVAPLSPTGTPMAGYIGAPPPTTALPGQGSPAGAGPAGGTTTSTNQGDFLQQLVSQMAANGSITGPLPPGFAGAPTTAQTPVPSASTMQQLYAQMAANGSLGGAR